MERIEYVASAFGIDKFILKVNNDLKTISVYRGNGKWEELESETTNYTKYRMGMMHGFIVVDENEAKRIMRRIDSGSGRE